mmetsp:Transcript_36153/g.47497  ORF Transcript_36153/g.47497 Transcript_36153/m.47497 type:complete len:123 (+) Transcript_36153:1271-1639(+)
MSKLILLVDDDEIHNYIAEVSLKKVFPNCRVQVEADPAKALLFLESNVPDLILLDINMRGLNGFEFLDAYIEKSLDSDETKIVMLSTSFFDKDVNRANSYEVVSEYMVKPCQFESLRPYLSK